MKARFKCLDCDNFDLCGPCEVTQAENHQSGTHLFAKIKDSTALTPGQLDSYRRKY